MLFFFFKQKTAYEMRISDWSSDVCSSDLPAEERGFALLHPRGSDRNEVERDLRVAGYTDPGAAAAFGMLRLAGAAVAGAMTALTLWLSGNWTGSRPLLAVAAAGFAFVGAKLALRSLATRRMRRVKAELPFVLDLLPMMLDSGVIFGKRSEE